MAAKGLKAMLEGLFTLFVVFLAVLCAPAMIRTWWAGGGWGLRALVSSVAQPPALIMSRDADPPPAPIAPVVLRTDDGRTTDAPPKPAYTPEQLLTFYRWLRSMGAKREEARAQLKAMGLPLSNDVWAKAEPPKPEADDLTVTPFAGRVTRRSFYADDPELEYQPPV
jgi:hypothetical protein